MTRRRLSARSGRDHYHPPHRSRRFLTVALSSVSSVAHRGDDRVRGRVHGRRLFDIGPPDHSPLHGAWSRRSDRGAGGRRVDGQIGRLSARRAHPTERRRLGRRRHLHRGWTRRCRYHRRRRLLDEPDLGTADPAGFPRAAGARRSGGDDRRQALRLRRRRRYRQRYRPGLRSGDRNGFGRRPPAGRPFGSGRGTDRRRHLSGRWVRRHPAAFRDLRDRGRDDVLDGRTPPGRPALPGGDPGRRTARDRRGARVERPRQPRLHVRPELGCDHLDGSSSRPRRSCGGVHPRRADLRRRRAERVGRGARGGERDRPHDLARRGGATARAARRRRRRRGRPPHLADRRLEHLHVEQGAPRVPARRDRNAASHGNGGSGTSQERAAATSTPRSRRSGCVLLWRTTPRSCTCRTACRGRSR